MANPQRYSSSFSSSTYVLLSQNNYSYCHLSCWRLWQHARPANLLSLPTSSPFLPPNFSATTTLPHLHLPGPQVPFLPQCPLSTTSNQRQLPRREKTKERTHACTDHTAYNFVAACYPRATCDPLCLAWGWHSSANERARKLTVAN